MFFARSFIEAKGKAEGKVEGLAEGKAEEKEDTGLTYEELVAIKERLQKEHA